MARSVATDFLSNARFQLVATSGDGTPRLVPAGRPDAGFTTSTVPDAAVDMKAYREGTFIYARKFPGLPTIGDVQLARGLARGDSSLWDWERVVIEGSGEYRADCLLKIFHRDTALNREFPAQGTQNKTSINTDSPAVIFFLHEAWPLRCKGSGDLDASSGEINIQELTLCLEDFEIQHNPAP